MSIFYPGYNEVDLARGAYEFLSAEHKFGKCESIPSNTWRDIWANGSTALGDIDYPFPTVARRFRIAAGGNANDTAAGSGAQSITVQYLDEDWNPQTETIATNGASASDWSTGTAIRIERAFVYDVGTYGGNNAGAVSIEHETSGDIVCYIGAGAGQTQLSMYSVQAGHRAILSEVNYTIGAAVSQQGDVRMLQRQNADVVTTPFRGVRLVHDMDGTIASNARIQYKSRRVFPEKTDIWCQARGVGATISVSADYDLILEEV